MVDSDMFPSGLTTQIIAYPNQYVYVQFAEQIDNQTLVPNSAYQPVQQLSLQVHNALASDIANVIYNLGNITLNSDGTRSTYRTIVLGIIDPSDGLFHSMWDIANQIPTGSSVNYSLSDKAFDGPHSFSGSITEYIDELSGGAQTQIDALNARSNILLAGNCTYDIKTNIFKIIGNLHIIGITGNKTYGIIGVIPSQEIKVASNQYLFIDESKTLKVGKFR